MSTPQAKETVVVKMAGLIKIGVESKVWARSVEDEIDNNSDWREERKKRDPCPYRVSFGVTGIVEDVEVVMDALETVNGLSISNCIIVPDSKGVQIDLEMPSNHWRGAHRLVSNALKGLGKPVPEQKIDPLVLTVDERLLLTFGYGLVHLFKPETGGTMMEALSTLRAGIAMHEGVLIPPIRIMDQTNLEPLEYVISIRGQVVFQQVLPNAEHETMAREVGARLIKAVPMIFSRQDLFNLLAHIGQTSAPNIVREINTVPGITALYNVCKVMLLNGKSIKNLESIIEMVLANPSP